MKSSHDMKIIHSIIRHVSQFCLNTDHFINNNKTVKKKSLKRPSRQETHSMQKHKMTTARKNFWGRCKGNIKA